MFKANRMRRAGAVFSLLTLLSLSAQPAMAAADHGGLESGASRRGAFAGAAYRLEFGARSRQPSARLQLGMRSVAADSQSAAAFNTRHVPVLEYGMGGRENGTIFIAGQSKAEMEQRLGLAGRTNTGEILLGVGLVVVLVYAVCCLKLLDTD